MNSSHIKCEHRCMLPTQHVGLAGSDSSICKCEVEQAQRKERKWVWARAAREKEVERGKETACSEERRRERTGCSFLQRWGAALLREAAEMWASVATDDRHQREKDGWRNDSYLPDIQWGGDGRMRKVLSLDGWRGVWQLRAAVL